MSDGIETLNSLTLNRFQPQTMSGYCRMVPSIVYSERAGGTHTAKQGSGPVRENLEAGVWAWMALSFESFKSSNPRRSF